jgi:hypothetical protein
MSQPLQSLAALLLTCLVLAGCTNRPTVCVCDPCGCTRVAAPLLEGCGALPAYEAAAKEASTASEAPAWSKTRKELPEHALATTKVKEIFWEELNLDQALSQLAKLTGVEFKVSPKVREERFEDIVYNLHLEDVAASSILDLMTEPFGLRYEERGSVVWVLTDEEIGGPKRLRYYDVKDLVGEGRSFAEAQALIDDIHVEVHPSYWLEDDAVIESRNGILIVRASQGIIEAIDDLLSHHRRKATPVILSAETAQKLGAVKVNLAGNGSSLKDAIKVLQIQTGLNLMIDPRVHADVAHKEVRGETMHDAPLLEVLEQVGKTAGDGMVWIQKGSVFLLTRREFLDGQ